LTALFRSRIISPEVRPMLCRKCRLEIPDASVYCCYCGIRQKTDRKPKTRGNGQGTAIRRGRTYEARVVVGWKEKDGHPTPIRRSKGGFKTKREALEYCVKLKEDNGLARRKTPTLQAYWNSYKKSEMTKLSYSKQTAYKCAWAKISPLHYRQIDTIGIAELRKIVSDACPSFYTARDCKILLNHLFELAGAEGFVSKDIPSYIVLPELKEKERQVFTVDEQKALWKLYESGDMDAAIPLVMICTGMMPGELKSLRVENIHLSEQKITGVGLKTKVRRESPIVVPEDILPVLEDLIAHAKPNGFLFTQNEESWYAAYYAALEKAGCRRLEPYCCRHSTATRLAITEGIAPQTIQRAMRWSSTKMLDRYAHPDTSDVVAAMNTIKKVE